MEVLGNVFLKVDVNPESFIKKMIEDEIGAGRFVVKVNKKFFISEIIGSISVSVSEITEDKFDYIQNLEAVLKYLNKK